LPLGMGAREAEGLAVTRSEKFGPWGCATQRAARFSGAAQNPKQERRC
jgi:hypothetical protein